MANATKRDDTPATVVPETHSPSGSRKQSYETQVYQALITLGASMPDVMIRQAGPFMSRCEQLGLDPKVAAATIYTSERHQHQVETTVIKEAASVAEEKTEASEEKAEEKPKASSSEEKPLTDCESCIPWVKVTRDVERYEACVREGARVGSISTPADVYRLLSPVLEKEDQEVFLVILLDVHQNLRGVCEVARGQRSRVTVSPADVLRPVVASGCESFIVVHNHPSSKPKPSTADIKLTETIRAASKPFGQETAFVDHVIIGVKQYHSIVEKKTYKEK